jgi:nucleoside 2-deoxyribosyltransferase
MDKCFVMQPFDGGIFDKRYEDTFAHAIRDAGLEPYRVDQDPKVSIPIQDIESGIRDSRICFAEITLDNPNVWFELGYAIAAGKEVVMVCSSERATKFPFDVQHRSIIRYSSESARDFEALRKQISTKIKAVLHREESLPKVSELAKLNKIEGLDQHEIVYLAALAENLDHPDDHASAQQIKRDMERSGFTKIATTLAVKSLVQKELVSYDRYQDYDGDSYVGYTLTENGWSWVLENRSRFMLRLPEQKPDEDLPF